MTTMAEVRGEKRLGGTLEVKDDGWGIEGLASTWELDEQGDEVQARRVRRDPAGQPRPPLLFSHDQAKVIGVATSLRETRDGLWGRWKLSRTELGRDVRELLRDKALDGLSIGFRCGPGDWEHDARRGARQLKRISLYEVSVVALPANLGARVAAVKSYAGSALGAPTALQEFLERQRGRRELADQRMKADILRLRLAVLTAERV